MIRHILQNVYLAIAIVLTSLIFFFTLTTSGLTCLIDLFPGSIYVAGANGSLLTGFTLNNISTQTEDAAISVETIVFSWQPAKIFQGKLVIDKLYVKGLKVMLKPSTTNTNTDTKRDYNSRWLRLVSHLTLNDFDADFLINQGAATNPDPIKGKIKFQFLQNVLSIETANIARSNAFFSLTGKVTDQWNLQWELQVAELASIKPELNGKLSNAGSIQGPLNSPYLTTTLIAEHLKLTNQQIDKITANLDILFKWNTPSHLHLLAQGIQLNDQTIEKADISLTSTTTKDDNNVQVSAVATLLKKYILDATLIIPKSINSSNYLNQNIQADITLHPASLTAIQNLAPIVQQLQGLIQGNIRFQGTLQEPTLLGHLSLTQGNMVIPKIGIVLKNINLQIAANEDKQLTYTGSLQSQSGTAKLHGKTDYADTNFTTQIQLKGDNFQIANTPEYKINVSPDLTFKYENHKMYVAGKIIIPNAAITPKDFSGTITLPSEATIISDKKPATESQWQSALPDVNIYLTSSDSVYIRYQSLEASLRGGLQITTTANSPPVATGELHTITGSYTAYGKVLTIEEGRLIYAGNLLANPGLNIKATRRINTTATGEQAYVTENPTITVGIQVLGTLNSPAISLFSNPAMDQKNILSYLMFGSPYSSTNNNQLLFSALSSMDLGGGHSQLNDLKDKLQQDFGLTELNVQSQQDLTSTTAGATTTSIVMGKQLTKEISLHYSQGLFSAGSYIFNIRYQLSKHFAFQSETSTIDNGADILYNIERD